MPTVPTYTRQVSPNIGSGARQRGGFTGQDFGAGVGQAIERVGDAWEAKQRADGEALAAEVISQAQLDDTERLIKLQQEARPGADGFAENYLQVHDSYYKERLEAIENPYAKQALEEYALRSRASYGQKALIFQAEEGVRNRIRNLETAADNESRLFQMMRPEELQIAVGQSIERGNQIIDSQPFSPEQKEQLKERLRKKKVGAAWETIKIKSPMGVVRRGMGTGFDAAMDVVFRNEGGFTALDGASGAPALFGVNRKWWEKDFDNIKAITESQGEAAGRQAAQEFYKREFWDKYQLDGLSPAAQIVVFDGVVNHHSGFVNRLVNAAKEGAATEQLVQMRRDEYERLGAKPEYAKDLKGWRNRMDRVEALSSVYGVSPVEAPSIFENMTAEEQMSAIEDMQRLAEQDKKLFSDDKGAWAERHGLTVEQTVSLSDNPRRAPVMSVERAKGIVNQMAEATPDIAIQLGQQMREEFGGYSRNAMIDLRRAKLPLAHEAAISLAMQDSVRYKKHIDFLMGSGNEKDSETNASFEVRTGKKEADIKDAIGKALKEDSLAELIQREVGRNEANARLNQTVDLTVQLAKAYLIQNPTESIEDAVAFALEPEISGYEVRSLNGNDYRVPKAHSADDVEQRMEQHFNDLARSVLASKDRDFRLERDSIIPVLNEDESGYFFIDPTGDVIPEAGEISFSELKAVQTRKEMRESMRKELKDLPYGEREKRRRQMLGLDVKEAIRASERRALAEKFSKRVGEK